MILALIVIIIIPHDDDDNGHFGIERISRRVHFAMNQIIIKFGLIPHREPFFMQLLDHFTVRGLDRSKDNFLLLLLCFSFLVVVVVLVWNTLQIRL